MLPVDFDIVVLCIHGMCQRVSVVICTAVITDINYCIKAAVQTCHHGFRGIGPAADQSHFIRHFFSNNISCTVMCVLYNDFFCACCQSTAACCQNFTGHLLLGCCMGIMIEFGFVPVCYVGYAFDVCTDINFHRVSTSSKSFYLCCTTIQRFSQSWSFCEGDSFLSKCDRICDILVI